MNNYDFVIPIKWDESKWGNNNELKYLLRSVEKYFPVNRVILVTNSNEIPDWLNTKKVTIIDYVDPFKFNKDANIIHKVLAAAKFKDITPTFFWSCDDHLILKDLRSTDVHPFYSINLKNQHAWWWSGLWKQGLKFTMEYLESKNKPTLFYDVHVPQPVPAKAFVSFFDKWKSEEHKRYTINTLFFNMIKSVKARHIENRKATFEAPVNDINEIKITCYNRLYLGYNDRGLTAALQQFINKKFPEKSKYEKR